MIAFFLKKLIVVNQRHNSRHFPLEFSCIFMHPWIEYHSVSKSLWKGKWCHSVVCCFLFSNVPWRVATCCTPRSTSVFSQGFPSKYTLYVDQNSLHEHWMCPIFSMWVLVFLSSSLILLLCRGVHRGRTLVTLVLPHPESRVWQVIHAPRMPADGLRGEGQYR